MKRIEAFVSPSIRDTVVDAMKKIGVGGITVMHAQGQGSADPPLVGQYFSKEVIVTVVQDSKVQPILDAIVGKACTGTKGDGKIFVSNVDQVVDICSKETGMDVL